LSMGKRTWTCVTCRKSYRRKPSLKSVECPSCQRPCELVPWWMRIPSPKKTKEWDVFWSNYKSNKAVQEDAEREAERAAALRAPKASPAKPRVSYFDGICAPLVRTLEHSACLPVHQLAGHAANLEFWVNEAKHCLAVIEGYQNALNGFAPARPSMRRSTMSSVRHHSFRGVQNIVRDKSAVGRFARRLKGS
jgi:hypothetical protein